MRLIPVERWKLVILANEALRARILETTVYELIHEIDTLKAEWLDERTSFQDEIRAEQGRTNAAFVMVDAKSSLAEYYRSQARRVKIERNVLIGGILIYTGIRIFKPGH